MRVQITMIADYPDTVSTAEAKAFIVDALTTWGGQRHPDDHLFHSMRVAKKNVQIVKSEK